LNYTGCIQWAFDDLPETWQFIQKGQTFIGFPAIVDEGDAVGVRIFDTEQKAALQHQSGLMRLLKLQLRKECTYIIKKHATVGSGRINLQSLTKTSRYIDVFPAVTWEQVHHIKKICCI